MDIEFRRPGAVRCVWSMQRARLRRMSRRLWICTEKENSTDRRVCLRVPLLCGKSVTASSPHMVTRADCLRYGAFSRKNWISNHQVRDKWWSSTPKGEPRNRRRRLEPYPGLLEAPSFPSSDNAKGCGNYEIVGRTRLIGFWGTRHLQHLSIQ